MRNLLTSFLTLLLFAVFLSSCQPELSAPPTTEPDPVTVDSTLLIKSITYTYHTFDSSETLGVSKETYTYDTTNRKIMVSVTNDAYGDAEYVFNYDVDHNLTHVDYTYPGISGIFNLIISYDASGVLSNMREVHPDGTITNTTFTKTVMGSRYELSWSGSPDEFSASVHEADGTILSYSHIFHPNSDPSQAWKSSDFYSYGSLGNVDQIVNRFNSPVDAPPVEEVTYQVYTRATSGDNLYNLRKLLYGARLHKLVVNGRENDIPLLTGLQFEPMIDEPHSRYPALTGKSHGYTFNNLVVIDNLNRLRRFRSFAVDIPIFAIDHAIEYYK